MLYVNVCIKGTMMNVNLRREHLHRQICFWLLDRDAEVGPFLNTEPEKLPIFE